MADKLDDDVEIHIVGGLKKILITEKKTTSKKIFFYGFIPQKSKFLYKCDGYLFVTNQK